jgi:hypothetical protein
MSSLNYREWDIFINERLKGRDGTFHGYYICFVPGFTMAQQTISFLNEAYELRTLRPLPLEVPIPPLMGGFQPESQQSSLPIRIYGEFDLAKDARKQIDSISLYLNALSMCVDFPLHMQAIQFIDCNQGLVFQASRRPFGRSVGFEVDERSGAASKIANDFDCFQAHLKDQDPRLKVAIRHYLTGMTLLGLEDQVPGLIDAAYMQFYQGIESLLGTSACDKAKKRIARTNVIDPRLAQIVCHQVFNVRHKYFGHGDEPDFHDISDRVPEEAVRLAKQSLVARWLCRVLIDSESQSQLPFFREMRIYGAQGSDEFRGIQDELKSRFWIDFGQIKEAGKRECKLYDATGCEIESIDFLKKPLS